MSSPGSGAGAGESPVYRPIRQVTVFWRGKRLTVRSLRATPADARQLSALTRQVAQEGWLGMSDPLGDAEHTLRFIQASLANGSVLLGMFDGRVLVGHLGLDRWPDPPPFRRAGLVLYLGPAYRGGGLGRALLQIGLVAARRLRITQVQAASHPANAAATALYKEAGFRLQASAGVIGDSRTDAADPANPFPEETLYWILDFAE